MTLPVDVSSLLGDSTWGPFACGPFKSSAGNYYAFRGSGGVSAIRAIKASDPTSSWAHCAYSGSLSYCQYLSAYRVGDVIHFIDISYNATSTVYASYCSFDMSSDTFSSIETIDGPYAITTSGAKGSLVVRSTGEVVAFYNGPQLKVSGTYRDRAYYKRRIGANNWSTRTEVDGAGAYHYYNPKAVLGLSDRVHFHFDKVGQSTDSFNHRSIDSTNAFDTAQDKGVGTGGDTLHAVRYVDGSDVKIFAATRYNSSQGWSYTSGANPTISAVSEPSVSGSLPGYPSELAVDGTDVWWYFKPLSGSITDLYASKSSDLGANWSTAEIIWDGNVYPSDNDMAIDSEIFARGNQHILGFFFYDSTLTQYLYNEYVVQGPQTQTLTPTKIDADDAFYEPTVVLFDQVLSPTAFLADDVFYSPEILQPGTLKPVHFDDAAVFYSPEIQAEKALPLTITGIDPAVSPVGPYRSSAGKFYFFGKDASTATTLQAYRTTSVTWVTFSSIATKTGFSTAINWIAGCRDGDVIHLLIIDGTSTSVNAKYVSFDMATEVFSSVETIVSAQNPSDGTGENPHYECGICVRSTGEVIAAFSGERATIGGSYYGRIYYSRRTEPNAWTEKVPIALRDLIADYVFRPTCVVGAADRVHFFWTGSISQIPHRSISADNVFDIEDDNDGGSWWPENRVSLSFPYGGNTRIIATSALTGASTACENYYMDSGPNATLQYTAPYFSGPFYNFAGAPVRVYVDLYDPAGVRIYYLFREETSGDIRVATSRDGGANMYETTLDQCPTAFTGTVPSDRKSMSVDSEPYIRDGAFRLPFLVNDDGTLKYCEYVARSPTPYYPTKFVDADSFYPPTVTQPNVVTVGLLATDVAQIGPFYYSGTVFFVGKDATTPTTLRAIGKSGSSFTSVATKTGFVDAIRKLSAFRVGSLVHVAVSDGNSGSQGVKYLIFDMSTGAFSTSVETVDSGFITGRAVTITPTTDHSGEHIASYLVYSGHNVYGPFQASSGKWYLVGDSWATGDVSLHLTIRRSSDPPSGAEFATVFASLATAAGAMMQGRGATCVQDGDKLHIVYQNMHASYDTYIHYCCYDMASETFTVQNETIWHGMNSPGSQYSPFSPHCAVRSNGEVVVHFCGDLNPPVSPPAYSTNPQCSYYSRRTGTNQWTAPVMTAQGTTNRGYFAGEITKDLQSDRIFMHSSPDYTGAPAIFSVLSESNVLHSQTDTNNSIEENGTWVCYVKPGETDTTVIFLGDQNAYCWRGTSADDMDLSYLGQMYMYDDFIRLVYFEEILYEFSRLGSGSNFGYHLSTNDGTSFGSGVALEGLSYDSYVGGNIGRFSNKVPFFRADANGGRYFVPYTFTSPLFGGGMTVDYGYNEVFIGEIIEHQHDVSIVVRDSGEVVVAYVGPREEVDASNIMRRAYYRRRLGAGSWSSAVKIINPDEETDHEADRVLAVLGASDRVHFVSGGFTQSIDASNNLDTRQAISVATERARAFDYAGGRRVAVVDATADPILSYFDSGASPTVHEVPGTAYVSPLGDPPCSFPRLFVDDCGGGRRPFLQMLYRMSQTNPNGWGSLEGQLWLVESPDCESWTPWRGHSVLIGIEEESENNLSRDGELFVSDDDKVIMGVLYNDRGILRYTELELRDMAFDPTWYGVGLLGGFDSAMDDESLGGHGSATVYGNAQVSSDSPLIGDASLLLPAPGDKIAWSHDDRLSAANASDKTYEIVFEVDSLATETALLDKRSSGSGEFYLAVLTDGTLRFRTYVGASVDVEISSSAGAISTGVTYRVALCRQSGRWQMFCGSGDTVDLVGSDVESAQPSSNSHDLVIG